MSCFAKQAAYVDAMQQDNSHSADKGTLPAKSQGLERFLGALQRVYRDTHWDVEEPFRRDYRDA